MNDWREDEDFDPGMMSGSSFDPGAVVCIGLCVLAWMCFLMVLVTGQ